MNYSRQREIILDTLTRNAVHPTAERLHQIIKAEDPESNLGIATVYRNLKKLAELGVIKKIEGLEESEHFDHNTHTHYHFLCTECNSVYDLDSDIAPDLVKKIESKTGFEVKNYDIIVQGICKNCKNK